MRIDCITSEAELRRLKPEWNALLQRSPADTIFLSWEWLWSWWQSYGGARQLCVLVARDEQAVCQGIAPLYIENYRTAGRSLRRLRFLGDGSYDSDYLDFIVDRNQDPGLKAGFLDHIAHLGNWDTAQLNEIPAESQSVGMITDFWGSSGYCERQEVLCSAIALPESWEDYLRMLRPRFRTAVRSALRNVEQLPGEVEELHSETQLPVWLGELFALHGDRWQTRNQSGVFDTAAKREFYRILSNELLQRGWLHFTRWRVQDVALAYQFGFVYEGSYYQLQEGFDPVSAHIGPGISLRASVIRDLIKAGVRKYDFMGGSGRHKTDWGAVEGKSVRLAVAPRTQAGFVSVRFPVLMDVAKVHVKKFSPAVALNARKKLQSAKALPVRQAAANQGASINRRELVMRALLRSGGMALTRQLAKKLEIVGRGPAGLRKRVTPKFVILSYHRVGTTGVPLYCQMAPELFEAQMKYLRANYQVLSIAEIYQQLRCPTGTQTGIAVTFDDGYLDTYTAAFPILKKYQIPATVYVVGEFIEKGILGWYDRVFLLLKHYPHEKLDLLLDRPRRFELSSEHSRLLAADKIVMFLRGSLDHKRVEICQQLESMVQLPEEELAGRMMNWEQVREMQSAGMNFGSHTMTHRVLSRLEVKDCQFELSASKALVEARTGRAVDDFAYPFGKRADYGSAAQELQSFGYRSAVTTESGANGPSASPYELRRMLTGGDESMPQFMWKISQLLLMNSEVAAGTASHGTTARIVNPRKARAIGVE